MVPRTGSSTMATGYMYNREDGRFFATLRMTGFATVISEMCRWQVGTNSYTEEAGVWFTELERMAICN